MALFAMCFHQVNVVIFGSILYFAEYVLLTLAFPLLVLFGFRVLSATTCMGGSSTLLHGHRTSHNIN